jgi:hypothetical protein
MASCPLIAFQIVFLCTLHMLIGGPVLFNSCIGVITPELVACVTFNVMRSYHFVFTGFYISTPTESYCYTVITFSICCFLATETLHDELFYSVVNLRSWKNGIVTTSILKVKHCEPSMHQKLVCDIISHQTYKQNPLWVTAYVISASSECIHHTKLSPLRLDIPFNKTNTSSNPFS